MQEAAAPARDEVAGEEVTAASHGCGHTGTACSGDDECCSGICSDARGTCCLGSGKRCKRCPVVWKRLAKQGLAEPDGKLRYVVIDVVPKRALKAARG